MIKHSFKVNISEGAFFHIQGVFDCLHLRPLVEITLFVVSKSVQDELKSVLSKRLSKVSVGERRVVFLTLMF